MSAHHPEQPSQPAAPTKIKAVALGRLAMLQKEPRRYGERRTEQLELRDTYHYAVRVVHQFTMPAHGDGRSGQDLLIPLGEFVKDRLPDLTVTDAAGTLLPVLSRAARGEAVATLYTSRWQRAIYRNLTEAQKPIADELWELVQVTIARIVTRPLKDANRLTDELELYLAQYAETHKTSIVGGNLKDLLASSDFWAGVRALATSRLLIAKIRAAPEDTTIVTISYTESLSYDSSGGNHIRGLLGWLGLIAIPISRQAANCGQAASFWTVVSAPSGVEILRIFWQSDRDLAGEESISVDANRAVAGRYEWAGDKPEENELLLDVQAAPSPSVLSAIGLALILLYISRYIYQGFPREGGGEQRTVLLALGSLLVTIPATIAGALAYRGEVFTRYANRGPRALVAGLSALAAILAVAVSLKGISKFVEDAAYVLSVYCVAVVGIFGYIQFGPRWRKSDASRWKKRAHGASPAECRRRQTRSAVIFFAVWVLVVVVFARCQIALQHKHFYTAFPREIWRAWWSWLRL